MDLDTLLAAYLPIRRRPALSEARVEDAYYGEHAVHLRWSGLRLLASMATASGIILLVLGVVPA
jgi:hypothetical protein